jgi:hypothetical protein
MVKHLVVLKDTLPGLFSALPVFVVQPFLLEGPGVEAAWFFPSVNLSSIVYQT